MKLGIVMDPIDSIQMASDTTFATMLEAKRRSWPIFYMETKDLYIDDGQPRAKMRPIHVSNNTDHWFDLEESQDLPLSALDAVFMRKDPPFNMEYIYTTYMLEKAQQEGCFVFNNPQALRDCNEKFYATYFSEFMPPSLVTKEAFRIQDFVTKHKKAVLKPLDWMAGTAIFNLNENDPNVPMILETFVTAPGRTVMVQKYIPEIVSHGDKRILFIHGEPIEHVFTRKPKIPGLPANSARGGTASKADITPRDRDICKAVGSVFKEKGLFFGAIDIIGDYLTEINITSPTGVRIIEDLYGFNTCDALLNALESHLGKSH